MTMIADKLASQVVQKAVENTSTGAANPANNEASAFSEMLQNTSDEMGFADALGMGNQQTVPNQAQAISAESISVNKDGSNAVSFESNKGGKVTNMLSDFNQQQMHMDNMVNDILYSGKKFNNSELLVMQAHVFRVAQMTELTVKTVELGVSSFKGVMNTQIQ